MDKTLKSWLRDVHTLIVPELARMEVNGADRTRTYYKLKLIRDHIEEILIDKV